MPDRRAKSAKNLQDTYPHRPPIDGRPTSFTSAPLRREAERGWEESDRSAAEGVKRRNDKARAHKLRRQTARDKDALIARLTRKVAQLEEQLAKLLRRPKGD